ncbi:maleylpyruvate isomerase N-terminal domain-containing protein [Kutzneria buriramensis]|uniref:maleylpyruvate isomerase N-terminal domain-containing protein n=1 Tax=Kutzneria buriramensis TaxID=1045776 RepID=UPI0035E49F19
MRSGRASRTRRRPAGTWCEGWTVRDILVHQAGNAEDLGRVLGAAAVGPTSGRRAALPQPGRPAGAGPTSSAAERILIGLLIGRGRDG